MGSENAQSRINLDGSLNFQPSSLGIFPRPQHGLSLILRDPLEGETLRALAKTGSSLGERCQKLSRVIFDHEPQDRVLVLLEPASGIGVRVAQIQLR